MVTALGGPNWLWQPPPSPRSRKRVGEGEEAGHSLIVLSEWLNYRLASLDHILCERIIVKLSSEHTK